MKLILIVAIIIYVLFVVTEMGVSYFINQGREKEVKMKKPSQVMKLFHRLFQRKVKVQQQG